MIKAIIFDCFGVLTTDLWREFTADLPDDQLAEARALNRARDNGVINHDDFRQSIRALTGRLPQDIEAMARGEVRKDVDLLSYIGELKRRGYTLGIISNVSSNWIRETFLTAEEQALFTDMVLSYEVGTSKPDERIYRLAAERLGVEPEQCLFVDDIEAYCAAARETGMQAVWYRDYRQATAELDAILSENSRR